MKKLNFGNINAGMDNIKELAAENSGIARDELIDVTLIDFAEKNSYAADDTEDSIRDLADQIEEVGLLNPLGVIQTGDRYKLFSGERRYKAITTHLHWEKIPCRVFEGVSQNRAQLMLHVANGGREYSAARKLELYEEYKDLLERMKESGEFKGGIQKGVAELLNVSDRQVRNYKVMSEQLTPEEKESVSSGTLTFGDAKAIAVERERTAEYAPDPEPEVEKTGTGSAFEESEDQEIPKEQNQAETSDPAPAPVQNPLTDEQREDLLRKFLLSGTGWDRKELYEYYVENMPTPQEAIKGILKPRYGYTGGSYPGRDIAHYTRTSTKLLLSSTYIAQSTIYSYSEVDAMIRELYRDELLYPEKQNKVR